jgi:uncharacterized protein YjeT (DUF2065 family)
MVLQSIQDTLGLCRLKGFVERSRSMSIQIVLDDDNGLSFWEKFVNQVAHGVSIVNLRPLLCCQDVSPSNQGLEKHEEIACAISLVFVVITLWLSWLRRQWKTLFDNQLNQFLVEANHRTLGIVRRCVQTQNIFHSPHKLGTNGGYAPLFPLHPRLKFLFFNSNRTVSREMLSTTFNITKRSASSCSVQRFRPSGGSLRAKVSRMASPFSSSFFNNRLPSRGSSLSALSRLPSTNRCRVRWTVGVLVCRMLAISLSLFPSSARRRIRARFSLRAECSPLLIRSSNDVRSSSVKSTI